MTKAKSSSKIIIVIVIIIRHLNHYIYHHLHHEAKSFTFWDKIQSKIGEILILVEIFLQTKETFLIVIWKFL